jgi:hypothetical protein
MEKFRSIRRQVVRLRARRSIREIVVALLLTFAALAFIVATVIRSGDPAGKTPPQAGAQKAV